MPAASFLNGGGEAGARLRGFDWERSPLGPPTRWPTALTNLVGIMLNSDQPMLIAWEESLIALYNDAYAELIGDLHPDMLGQPLFETWADAGDAVEPLFRRALAGEPTRLDQVVIPIRRSGRTVPAQFRISYTPVPDRDRIGGVLCISMDTPDGVIAERRKAALLELSDRLRALDEPRDIVAAAVEFLGRHMQASRVGYGEVQSDDRTILLETSYVDGVTPLSGLFDLEAFGHENIERQRQGQTVAHDDVAIVDGIDPAGWNAIETRSFASVPLIRDGRLRASLYVNFREPHAWASDEVSLLEEVAARIWDSLERARAEEALRASEARFRAAVGAVQGILWTNNAAGEMEGEQAGWAALTGQARQAYQGYGWADAVHPEDARPTVNAWRMAVEARRPFLFEHRIRRHDGAWRTFAIRAIPILDGAGMIREWVGVHTDVTEQRAAEMRLSQQVIEEQALNAQLLDQGEALKRAQESLQTIFNASSEGLTLCRLMRDETGQVIDYQVLDVNPAHGVLAAAPRAQMLAKPVTQILPPIDPRWLTTAEAAVRTGAMQSFEVRNRHTGRWLDIHVSPVSGDLFAQTFIDVTARHEAEEQRTQLVAEMNHRVMNNFQMVASVLDLQARRSQNGDVREQLANAVRRVHLLSELHQRLAFAPDGGEVDVQAYLMAVCEGLRSSIADPGRVRLVVRIEQATLDSAVAVPLGFVVNELVTNAIKYAFPAPADGEISVTFGGEPEGFVLQVADGGAGLPASVETKGTGLGMRLVSSFVAQVGGTLDVRHSPGVEYVIRVPRSAPPI